jgi:hypothetical protein
MFTIFTIIVTAIIGLFTGYMASLLQQLASRREQLSTILAKYYSSAANAHYAWAEFDQCPTDSPNWQYLHGQDKKYYEAFLTNSTALFALVPPDIGEEILALEDLWEEIEDPTDSELEQKWFDELDRIRYRLLPLIRNRFLEPSVQSYILHLPVTLLNRLFNKMQQKIISNMPSKSKKKKP